jgi:hypothetical protein
LLSSTSFLKVKAAWYITAGVFLLHFLPYLLYPGDAYIRIHDTLDGEWIWLHVLNQTHTAWNFHADTVVAPIMNGLPRSAMPTGISVPMFLVYVFGAYWSYVINYSLIHLVGFASMYFFLRKYVIKENVDPAAENHSKALIIYTSLIFSLIPVYTPFGLSVMGQPLLAGIFITSLKGGLKYYHYLLLALFPLYSSLVWIGIPAIIALSFIWIYQAARNKKIYFQYILAAFILTVSYALVNYNIFQIALFPPEGFISHRTAYQSYLFMPPNLQWSINDFLQHFFTLHHHVGTMVTIPIILMGVIAYNKNNQWLKNISILIFVIVIFQSTYNFFEYYVGPYIGFIRSFRLSRFNIALPFLWMMVLVLALKHWRSVPVLRKTLPVVLFSILLITSLGNDEILHNYRRIVGAYHFPTYKNYIAENQFGAIKKLIGKDPSTYRIACLGMNPAIPQYNGFYTLDGLQSIYNLNYKKQFRKIFQKELEKNKDLSDYFDGWGNRCYIFSDEVGKEWDAFLPPERTDRKVHIELDPVAFKALGGEYIFSAFELENLPGFHPLMVAEGKDSWWKVHVYQVNHE